MENFARVSFTLILLSTWWKKTRPGAGAIGKYEGLKLLFSRIRLQLACAGVDMPKTSLPRPKIPLLPGSYLDSAKEPLMIAITSQYLISHILILADGLDYISLKSAWKCQNPWTSSTKKTRDIVNSIGKNPIDGHPVLVNFKARLRLLLARFVTARSRCEVLQIARAIVDCGTSFPPKVIFASWCCFKSIYRSWLSGPTFFPRKIMRIIFYNNSWLCQRLQLVRHLVGAGGYEGIRQRG